MEILLLFLFMLFLSFLDFFGREREEKRIYEKTVNDVNWNRDKR